MRHSLQGSSTFRVLGGSSICVDVTAPVNDIADPSDDEEDDVDVGNEADEENCVAVAIDDWVKSSSITVPKSSSFSSSSSPTWSNFNNCLISLSLFQTTCFKKSDALNSPAANCLFSLSSCLSRSYEKLKQIISNTSRMENGKKAKKELTTHSGLRRLAVAPPLS